MNQILPTILVTALLPVVASAAEAPLGYSFGQAGDRPAPVITQQMIIERISTGQRIQSLITDIMPAMKDEPAIADVRPLVVYIDL